MTIDDQNEQANRMIASARLGRESGSLKEPLFPKQLIANIWKLEAAPGMRAAVIDTVGNGRDGYPSSNDTAWLASHPEDGEWQKFIPKLDAMVTDVGNRLLLQGLADWEDRLSAIVLPPAGLTTNEMDTFLKEAETTLRGQYPDELRFFSNAGWVERIVTALLECEVPISSTPSATLQDGIDQFRQHDIHFGDLLARVIHTPYVFNPLLPRGAPYISSGLRVNLPQFLPRDDQLWESLAFSPAQESRLQEVAGEVITTVARGVLPIEFPAE